MISILREFTKSWAFKGLMVALMGGFCIFGVSKFSDMGGGTGTNVVTAGKRTVTSREFKQRYDNLRQNYEQQGKSFTNEEFVEAGQHTVMLKELADETAFSAWLDTMGVKPSAKLLVAKIAEIPQFFNSVTGRFDRDTYTQTLARAQMTVPAFEADMSDRMAQQQYVDAAVAGLTPPRIFAAMDAALGLQSRDATMFVLSDRNVPPPAMPTDAELTTFYNSIKERLMRPELRAVSVVMFSPQQYLAGITVDDAELHKAYEAQRAKLATPETRTFVQVTAPDMSAAAKVAADLKAGQAPDVVAKKYKGEVISYTLKPRNAVADTKVGDSAFAMQTGQVSDPIQGNLGIAVIKMGDIHIGSTPSFESVRANLVETYRTEKAADKVNEVSRAFSDAMNKGEDFDATAKQLGLSATQLPPMTLEGKALNPVTGQPLVDPKTGKPVDYSVYAPLVKAVFDLQQPGSASDVEEFGGGQYFAVKLNNVYPAGATPLAQIRDDLVRAWQVQKLQEALSVKADEARARLAKGEAIAAVAASYNAPIKTFSGLTAESAQQQVPQQIASRIFGVQANEAFQAQTGPVSFIVGKVDAIHQGAADAANTRAAMVQTQMGNSVAQDLIDLTKKGARKAVKTTTNIDAVLRELNVTPPAADTTKPGAKPDGKAKS